MPFGRTDLSIFGIGATVHALLHRHGPVGPSVQGMPEKFDFHISVWPFLLKVVYANEHGWISFLRAENNAR